MRLASRCKDREEGIGKRHAREKEKEKLSPAEEEEEEAVATTASNASASSDSDSDSEQQVSVMGIDRRGYLRVRTETTGQELSLQPDGNTFDILKGLIAIKEHR